MIRLLKRGRTRDAASYSAPHVALLLVLITAIVVGEFLKPLYLDSLRLHAVIETAVTLSAVAGALLLGLAFCRRGRWDDWVLLTAVVCVTVTHFVVSALPALTGVGATLPGPDAQVSVNVVVAIAFVAAAFAPREAPAPEVRRALALTAALGLVALVAAVVNQLSVARGVEGVVSSTTDDLQISELAGMIAIGSSLAMAAGGIGLLNRGASASSGAWLLATAMLLLAATMLQPLAMPVVSVNSVSVADAARAVAYILVLFVAAMRSDDSRRAIVNDAIRTERRRIARDLHDGLAQDLAIIALHSQQLPATIDAEHPLTLAARRALTQARGRVLELSASEEPTIGAALRRVGDELASRLPVETAVHTDAAGEVVSGLDDGIREDLVRTAREAILNAALHGEARNVTVTLDSVGALARLRIADDGRGAPAGAFTNPRGFGLRTMTARTHARGGTVTAGHRAQGGTTIEVLVPTGRRTRSRLRGSVWSLRGETAAAPVPFRWFSPSTREG